MGDRGAKGMGEWVKVGVVLFAALLLLAGCSTRPRTYTRSYDVAVNQEAAARQAVQDVLADQQTAAEGAGKSELAEKTPRQRLRWDAKDRELIVRTTKAGYQRVREVLGRMEGQP
jgi:hypothetical protein